MVYENKLEEKSEKSLDSVNRALRMIWGGVPETRILTGGWRVKAVLIVSQVEM